MGYTNRAKAVGYILASGIYPLGDWRLYYVGYLPAGNRRHDAAAIPVAYVYDGPV